MIKIGIDEAGRGPLAGPLVMTGILVLDKKANQIIKQCKDSKQTKESERNKLFGMLINSYQQGYLDYYSAIIDSKEIDEGLMRSAIRTGAKQISDYFIGKYDSQKILFQIDGPFDFGLRKYGFVCETIIKGDSLISLISAASIIAKVTRDTTMIEFDQQFPEYGFAQHKGYGTKKHLEAIKIFGLSDIHRKSFCRRFIEKVLE